MGTIELILGLHSLYRTVKDIQTEFSPSNDSLEQTGTPSVVVELSDEAIQLYIRDAEGTFEEYLTTEQIKGDTAIPGPSRW